MSTGRRYLIATGVTTELVVSAPRVAESVRTMVDLFTDTFGYSRATSLNLNPPIQTFRDELRNFCEERSPDDLVVLYYTGHAGLVSRRHKLWMGDTRNPVSGALPTSELAELMLDDTPLRRAMIIIDACHAGEGGAEALLSGMVAMDRDDKTLVVITAAHPKEQIKAGEFARLFVNAVRHPSTAGYEPKYLSTSAIVDRINADPSRSPSQTVAESVLFRQSEYEPFLPNPRYNPSLHGLDLLTQLRIEQRELRRQELKSHFIPKARGGRHAKETEWRFVGRHAVLRELVAWLQDPTDSRARVVTGGPGSGKSAVIGRLAVFSDPEWRSSVPRDGLPADVIPPQNSLDVVINARGLTSLQVLDGLNAAVGAKPHGVGELVQAVGSRRVVAAIDAIDEAVDPDKLVSEILCPLIEAGPDCGLRLLLGTRKHLVNRLSSPKMVLDLDDARYADPKSMRRYIEDLLVNAEPNSPYRNQPETVVLDVADAVASAANHSFLVALIVSRMLAALPRVPEPRDEIWRASLPGTAAQAMHYDLESRLQGQAQRARELLTPLAFSQGVGLPWENLWAPLATELSGRKYTDEDLIWLRRVAGSYVVEAEDRGRSVYRLYHAALAEYLRQAHEEKDLQRSITSFLLRHAGTDWSRAHPYIRAHLATHSVLAADGTLDRLVTDPDYLLAAEPAPLLAALPHTCSSEARSAGMAYRRALHLLRQKRREERLSYLELAAHRAGARLLVERIRARGKDRPWEPLWSQWPPEHPHRVLAGHHGPVTSLSVSDAVGKPCVVSVGVDRTVRTWDVMTGEQISRVNLGDGAEPAVTVKIDRAARTALVVDRFGELTVWDAVSGTLRLRQPLAPRWRRRLNRLLGGDLFADFAELNGREVIVTAGSGLRTTYWDPNTGKRLLTLGTGAKPSVLRYLRFKDWRSVIVDPSSAKVKIWDQTTGRQLPAAGVHRLWSRFDLFWSEKSGDVVLALETPRWFADHLPQRLWDLTSDKVLWRGSLQYAGKKIAVPLDDERTITIERGSRRGTRATNLGVILTLNGAPLLSSDLLHQPEYEPDDSLVLTIDQEEVRLEGHIGKVTGHVVTQLSDGRRAVVTSGADATVRVWHIDDRDEWSTNENPVDTIGLVQAVDAGDSPVGLSAGRGAFESDNARVWDLLTGQILHEFVTVGVSSAYGITISRGRIEYVAFNLDHHCTTADARTGERRRAFPADPIYWPFTVVTDDRIALTSGHGKNAVLWDLDEGKVVRILKGHRGWVGAVGIGRLADGDRVAVTAGGDLRVIVWNLSHRLRKSKFWVTPPWKRILVPLLQAKPVACPYQVAHARWDSNSAVLVLTEPGADLQVHTASRPGRKYRKRKELASSVTAFTTLDDIVVFANLDGQIEVWRLGRKEPLLTLEVEARVRNLALTKSGILFAATTKGLSAFRIATHLLFETS